MYGLWSMVYGHDLWFISLWFMIYGFWFICSDCELSINAMNLEFCIFASDIGQQGREIRTLGLDQ